MNNAPRNPRFGTLLGALGLFWVVAVVAGVSNLNRYEMTPGAAAAAANWPSNTRLTLDSHRDTLLMFVHPLCPCSDASMEELARGLAQAEDRLSTTVVFFKPSGQTDDWVKASLWNSARRIPGVSAIIDPGGALAERFDARTSGQVFLYQPDGRLIFSGGITGSRGHAGDNAGMEAIVALATGSAAVRDPVPASTPVFGCSILPGLRSAQCSRSVSATNQP
jgi:hypothetical protein